MSFKNKDLIIRVNSPTEFVGSSLYTVWVNRKDGIKLVMGKRQKDNKVDIQSYLFNPFWNLDAAKKWLVGNKGSSMVEKLGRNRFYVNSSMKLCSSAPKLSLSDDVNLLTQASFEASAKLNSRYYLFVEGVHEGFNGNNFYFYKDEMTENYKSAGYQPIDWMHIQEQVIGFSLESELISRHEQPLALAISGILNRLSPHMQVEERLDDAKMITRDDLIRQRFFENRLAISMECYFDKARCTKCAFETDNWLEFEFHLWSCHSKEIDEGEQIGMGGVGIDFVGWGIVDQPADPEAYILSLRTSDDGTIQDIAEASVKEKYGPVADNMAFSKIVAESVPHDMLLSMAGNLVFASDKPEQLHYVTRKELEEYVKNSPIIDNKNDNNKETIDITIAGGIKMFDLLKKTAEAKSLGEIFVIAQTELAAYLTDNKFTDEAQKAFVDEVSQIIITFAETSKDEAVATAVKTTKDEMDESLKVLVAEHETAKATIQEQMTAVQTAKEQVETELAEIKAKYATLEEEQTKKEIDARVEEVVTEIESDGVVFADFFADEARNIIRLKLASDSSEEELKKFKRGIVATFKQAALLSGSENNGGISGGGNDESGTLTEKYEKIRKEYEDSKK
uniref:Uncharacterized protein n=1 Tax=viral metagenome TaxID=1070528 RepID=A0A6M3IIC0_9ZZZZ